MRFVALVNEYRTLDPGSTTTELIDGLRARDHRVMVTAIDTLCLLPDGEVAARDIDGGEVRFGDVDAVLVRTNPARGGRDRLQAEVLLLLAQAKMRGCLVLNDPEGLFHASSKVFLAHLPPETTPRMVVSADPRRLRQFAAEVGAPCVFKPTRGTRGKDVFLVRTPDADNLGAIVEHLCESGPAMAQAFVPGASDGDTRVLMVDGEPLRVDGRIAAVRRIPGEGEFRSNVHVGGMPSRAALDDAARSTLQAVGPVLRQYGLFFVGLDLIGSQIIEVNVWAPGGVGDAGRLEERRFLDALLDALEARVRAWHPRPQGELT